MAKRRIERRQHKRLELPCVLKLMDDEGAVAATTKTVNISDGGVLVSVPLEALPECNASMELSFSVPRYTANTFMLEEFDCRGKVLRHHPLVDDRFAGVAIGFTKPLKLGLEV